LGKNKAIEERKKILQETINEISKEEHHPIFRDLDLIDHKSLIALDSLLLFCCVDGAIRLGWVDLPEPLKDPWEVFDQGVRLYATMNLDRMAELSLQNDNLAAQETLLRYLSNRIRTLKEIQARLKRNPLGHKYLWRMAPGAPPWGEAELMDLGTEWERIVKGFVKNNPGRFTRKADGRINVPPLAEMYRKGSHRGKAPLDPEKVLDRLLDGAHYFDSLIKTFDVERFPMSALAKQIPLEPWDRVAPEIMHGLIRDHVSQLDPVLRGDAEKMPLKIFDRWKYRLDPDRKIDAMEMGRVVPPPVKDEDGDDLTWDPIEYKIQDRDDQREERKILDKISPAPNPILLALDEILAEEKPRKAEKIRQAFHFRFVEGLTQKEASRTAGISEDTFRIYVKKIIEKHQKYSRLKTNPEKN